MKKKYTTRHGQNGDWSFTVFNFSPGVICAERIIPWYDDNKFIHLKRVLERKGCLFCWNEAADNYSKISKHSTRVELYIKVNKDLPFKEKMSLAIPLCEIIDK